VAFAGARATIGSASALLEADAETTLEVTPAITGTVIDLTLELGGNSATLRSDLALDFDAVGWPATTVTQAITLMPRRVTSDGSCALLHTNLVTDHGGSFSDYGPGFYADELCGSFATGAP